MENQQSPKQTTPWLWIAAGGLVLLTCACMATLVVAGATGAALYLAQHETAGSFPVITAAAVEPEIVTPFPTIPVTPPAPSDPQAGGVDELAAELPPRDRYDLARRFLGIEEADPPEPVEYHIGDTATFWVDNDDTETTVEVKADLVYMTDVVYMWVEQGVDYDYDALVESAERFSKSTYPTNHSYFGTEASPGIDGDPRLHVLHSTQLGFTVAGYFYSPSEYPASVVPYSNEKEIFFINIANAPPGDYYYDSVLAHEFQHMIHWNVDQNEESWMNEGLSELAALLNGYGPSDWTSTFLVNPDLQLTGWPEDGAGANYGAAFLFTTYFLDRFGQDALRALVANPLNGLAGVDDTLEQIGAGVSADDVFADWVVANLINDPGVSSSQYAYTSLLDLFPVAVTGTVAAYPFETDWQQVHQYGADYIQIIPPGEVTLRFEGASQVRILSTDTHDTDDNASTEDRFVWWSNRGDDSNMTLTHAVDLSGVADAILEFDVWYAIEEGWDYAYVTVSADGGETWTILPTPHTTTDDPHGNSYGPGYTGNSFDQPGADAEGWLHETLDLGDYAGQEILLRFEMITDDAVNQPGLAIDNLSIEAIGWYDNVEEGAEGWEARGFLRHNNVLPQEFAVQVVVPGPSGMRVESLSLDDANRGAISFSVEAGSPATLIVSGLTRYTSEPALYRYSLIPTSR